MPRKPSNSSNHSKPGILKIAAELGVSTATVSRALRPETAHMVSEERRKQILDLADRMHFSPNPGARMIRKGINTTLTVIVPLDESIFFSEFYSRFLSGTLRSAAARDWDVQIRTLKRKPGANFRETMQHISMDSSGIIYMAEPLSKTELDQLQDYHRPLIMTKAVLPHDVDVSSLGLPVVGVNNLTGSRSAISLLQQLGHNKIGLLLGPHKSRDAFERRTGYLEIIKSADLDTRPEWIIEGSFNVEGGRCSMEKLLACDEWPTAICCASDEIAFGAITAMNACGKQCPEDLSIVGFDDGFWATMSRPALTTVRQPLADMAERAVVAIMEAANSRGQNHPPQPAELATSLVIRESTKMVSHS